MSVVRLESYAQCYEWGKLGSSSKVAQYAKATLGDSFSEDKPYAELWMGTHPTVPSKVKSTGLTLLAHLAANPHLVGDRVRKRFGPDLPFLFKVLAVHKALSIQAHPNKTLAEKLHRERPDVYKDDNHKPEMAIAITPFKGLCGFRPLDEISHFLQTIPELGQIVSKERTSRLIAASSESDKKAALKECFAALMNADNALIKDSLAALIKRYESQADEKETDLAELVQDLNRQYPNDVGVFCVFYLNVVTLDVGEAMFLCADEPHAYISGDIIECMATSDNVVRAGLTPKLRDVPTLVQMLTYTSAPHSLMKPTRFRSTLYTILYDPPIDEFSVLYTKLGRGEEEIHEAIDGPSIFIVTSGRGTLVSADGRTEEELEEGAVFFVGAATPLSFKADDISGLAIHRAFVQVP